MPICRAEQGVTDLPEIIPSLLVLPPAGNRAAYVEGIDKGINLDFASKAQKT